ncbi:MAG: hypothetical protein HZA17_12405 [Nitrospirae bacterium]|nr:hypothetical protein [Nitrospirota bacterium]
MKPDVSERNPLAGFLRVFAEMISSKGFLIGVIGLWLVYYMFSAIWLSESFAHFVMGLQRRWIMRIPFLIFLTSGYLNLIRASKEIIRQEKMQFICWFCLPLGIMLFATGFFMSLSLRHFEWIVVGEGHEISPRWSREKFMVKSIDLGILDRFLDIDADRGMGIFQYEPKVVISDESSRLHTVGAFPAKKIGNTYFHILNFGLAPGVTITEAAGIRTEGYMPLKILGAGSSDSFEIEPYPYRFVISMEPERVIEKGRVKASEFNVRDPRYSVRVFREEKIIAEGISGQPIVFDDLTLNFIKTTNWVQLEAVKDYGYPVILAGIFLIIIGIPASLFRGGVRLRRKNK